MLPNEQSLRFLERFESIRHRMRWMNLARLVFQAMLAAAAATAVLAWVDYRFEDGSSARMWRLAGLGGALVILFVYQAWRVIAKWSKPATAVELEHRFPELGQRVRTTVQYGPQGDDAIRRGGVTPSLVDALRVDTAEKTEPLGLDTVLPVRRMWLTAGLAVAAVVGLLASTLSDWEWRTAVRRTLLSDEPYTTVSVTPGNIVVDEGGRVDLSLTVSGRTSREVVVWSRPAMRADAAWLREELKSDESVAGGEWQVSFTSQIARITEPMEYRVVAGPAASDLYHIDVRYPLAIESVETQVTSPEYTGLPIKTIADGSVTALRGSRGEFRVTLDRVPAAAHVRVTPARDATGAASAPHELPVQIDGTQVQFALDLDRDLTWSLAATSGDGSPLPDNAFRVRVRDDGAPRVTFGEPQDELEVTTLAEVLMQIRASDDYGLTRSGIVFQINNDEEHTLLEEDFARVMEAAQAAESGTVTPRTRAALERTLPLEYFGLTERDAVAYYAFAEDNFPEAPHRAETDLRFIDIRPFKTVYRLSDEEPGMPGMQNDIPALDELIRRQRYALNRTIKLQKFPERWGDGDLNSVERLIEYQTEIADGTRDLATFFEGEGTDGADVLFQAEATMRTAVDSLGVAQYETAVLQEKDALQYLVEARRKLEVVINRLNARQRASIRQFNRQLTQKLRRPRNEEEAERQVVERLQQLAMNEGMLAAALTQEPTDNQAAGGEGSAPMGGQPPDEPKPAEPADAPPVEPQPQPAEQPEGTGNVPAPMEGDSPQEAPDGAGDPMGEGDKGTSPSELTPQEIEDRQADVVAEAQDVQRLLEGMSAITDLAKSRMTAAVESADAASGALQRGEREQAAESAREAAQKFRELARHVAGLVEDEAARQVAMARDLAGDIAYRNQELADQLEEARQGAGMPQSPPQEDASPQGGAARAMAPRNPQEESGRLRDSAETLRDVMEAIARDNDGDSVEAKDRVAELLESDELAQAMEGQQQLPETLSQSRTPPAETIASVRGIGERMELTAVELDRLYRTILTPRVEELKQLEERAAELEQELTELETEADITEWHQAADELLTEVEEQNVASGASEELRQVMREGGWDATGTIDWRWSRSGLFYRAPGTYTARTRLLTQALQELMQELVLVDLLSARDEATPPGYEQFVERYLKVLSTGTGNEQP
jgi:hypothetical protein